MAASQSHGFVFEQFVRSRLQALQPDDRLCAPVANPTSFFDIQTGGVAPGVAGSIKTAAAGARSLQPEEGADAVVATVALADARRVWSWPFLTNIQSQQGSVFPASLRFIVGVYRQEGDYKVFNWVYEVDLVFDQATNDALFGGISFGDVFAFHSGLGLEFFPEGAHKAARQWAKAHKRDLKLKSPGAIDLNFKVDSQKQRRLQCTIPLPALLKAAKSWRVNAGPFFLELPIELPLIGEDGMTKTHSQANGPLRVLSPPRKLKKKAEEGPSPSES